MVWFLMAVCLLVRFLLERDAFFAPLNIVHEHGRNCWCRASRLSL
jgi:hypothetical protein